MSWIFWLIVAVALAVIELATVNLVCIWFVISAAATIFVSLATGNLLIQLVVFVVGGLIFMLLTRPILIKKLGTRYERTNLDRVVGMKGVVTEKIEPLSVGEIKVDGKRWSAVAEETIENDTIVIVDSIDGVKLKVHRVDN